MSVSCPSCGDRVENTYDCRQCGDAFCIDCRLPDDHECVSETDGADSESELVTSVRRSVASFDEAMRPAARRWRTVPWPIPVLLSVVVFPPSWLIYWGVVPWPVPTVLAAAALPLSWLIFGAHVYAERLTPAGAAWTPSRVYYLPTVTAVVLGVVPLVGLGITAVISYPLLLVTVPIYAVRRIRRSGGSAESDAADGDVTDDEITDLLDTARTHAGTAREAVADGDHDRAADEYEQAIEQAERARERADDGFPDRVPEIEEYLSMLRQHREETAAEQSD